MSMKLLEAVYQLDKNATTATEQAVLAALAYRANDKTHLCFPKQETRSKHCIWYNMHRRARKELRL